MKKMQLALAMLLLLGLVSMNALDLPASAQTVISAIKLGEGGYSPVAVGVNPTTNRIYVARLWGGNGDGGLAARTVHHHHRLLHTALEHAVKQGHVARMVAKAVDPPHPGRSQVGRVNPEDIGKILSVARETPYFLPVYAALYTGLRRGELLGLRWCDADLDLASLSIIQALYKLRHGGYVFQEPKTTRSRRKVPLGPSLALLLRKHREGQQAQGILLGRPLQETDLVFAGPDGKPLQPDTLTKAFHKIVKRAGLSGVRFHDLRHAHASLMLKAGVHPKVVSERLGHSRIAITLDTYSHVVPGLQEAAAKRFEEVLEEDVAKMLPHPAEIDGRGGRI